MTENENRDVTARLTELEATVRGLTQELVSCEERIRQLEAALEEQTERATKDTRGEAEAEAEDSSDDTAEETSGDVEDIIVA